MIWSLSETLKFIEPHLPNQLVSPKAFAHIQSIANLLPDAMSAHYFETRLGAHATQVDFSTCAIAQKGGREILAGRSATVNWAHILLENPWWSRIFAFFRDWADPTSPLYEQVPLVWLEFDKVHEPLPAIPIPCVNICLDPRYLEWHAHSQHISHPNTRRFQPFIEAPLEHLLGYPIPPQTKQNLFSCFELLPSDGQIVYISIMLPREPATIKLNGFISKDRFLEYLAKIGWTGSLTKIGEMLTTFCTGTDTIRFDITVGQKISSRVGIELFSKGLPRSDTWRHFILVQFVDRQMCSLEKGQALLDWSGFSSETFNHQSWPTRLNRSWYVKIVYYHANRPLEAKGYLGFTPNFFMPFTLT